MAATLFDNVIANMGYRNAPEFILKYAMPFMGAIVFSFFIIVIFIPILPFWASLSFLAIGTIGVMGYPYMKFEKRKVGIEENLHLFITFAGTISTIDISRNMLFKKIAQRRALGEVADSAEKILYFAKKWNLGYSKTCRIVAQMSPSKIYGDFLDRLAIMLDFGESLDVFLIDEQDAIMDDFATNYKKALENIKTVQEIFIALTMALGFMIAIALMLPLVSGTPIGVVVRYALLGMLLLDLGILMFVRNFIPSDKLMYKGKILSKDVQSLYKWVLVCFPIAAILTIAAFFIGKTNFITNIGIGLLPLFVLGIKAQYVENSIYTREKAYPSFIRAFGTAIEVKSGAVDAAIMSLRVHDFGPLNEPLTSLYRRLKTGCDKYLSWDYFNSASGSNLIYQFTGIFSESLFLGGQPQKIGELISHNFSRLISLRKLRQQLASGFRGSLYGALVGFSAAAFVSAKITEMLGQIFSNPFGGGAASDNPLASIVTSIAPLSLDVDMSQIAIYIAIMIILHAIISSLIIKVVDGGSVFSAFFDASIMIWLGVIISYVVPWGIEVLIPGFSSLAGSI